MNVKDLMDVLDIKDISTPRQTKNGTIVWQLPIKINYPGNAERFIEVASFKTGYVRNQNCGYSNYQLNKRCDSEPEYYNINPPNKEPLYRKFITRSCVLIPNEIDRLEYLIAYCLKNYYIKLANQVVEGKYVSKWEHEYELERNAHTQKQRGDGYKEGCSHKNQEINNLEKDLVNMTEARDYYLNKTHSLENKLATINKISE